MDKLIAWHGNPELKAKYAARVKAHAAADEIVQGVYWENGKGCAIGCTIEGSEHDRYETELGIPAAIAHVEDGLFEALPEEDAKAFPLRFVEAIEPGADLSLVTSHLMFDVLLDETNGLIAMADLPDDVSRAITMVGSCYRLRLSGNEPSEDEWQAAGDAARDARDARAARDARDARAAWDARDARDARAAWDARDAWAAHSKWQADRLIHHLSTAPISASV